LTRWLTDPALVGRIFPLVGVAFFLECYCGQLWQMWTKHTAAGQSLAGWIGLLIALWTYHRFYSICCPKERVAIWSVRAEMLVNAAIIVSVVVLR
jgi:hypothetical protein